MPWFYTPPIHQQEAVLNYDSGQGNTVYSDHDS